MQKLLIANRGEIACRIIRTARRLGIATVAVHSDADANALHVRMADEAVAIGPAPAAESYLNIAAILGAAAKTGADAIHPGYGFLSENAGFAAACADAGLCFVGPGAEAIRLMGLKDSAKARMKAAGVPVTPGYMGEDQSLARLERMAELVGYPLLIKAVAGGGGRGMRPVFARSEFTEALLAAKREAQGAFGNDSVMLERLIRRPRHVEVQIFGDSHGNFVHLFERDCSLQRRHQKVVEEAPAPGLSARLRHILGIAAITAGMAIGYRNAGTVEFILDTEDLDAEGDPQFYFMEMNTRLQVEHPVTEAITGQDLVEWQLRIAEGEMLPLMQEAIEPQGHAVEVRLYAEAPERGFLPATGRLDRLVFPGTVRVDSGVEEGDEVGIHYDPMLAKLIAHGPTRAAAIERLVRALDATIVEGVATNRGFLGRLLSLSGFRSGDVHTGLLAAHEAALVAPVPEVSWPVAVAAAFDGAPAPAGETGFAAPFRLNLPLVHHGALYTPDGRSHRTAVSGTSVAVDGAPPVEVALRADGSGWRATVGGEVHHVALVRSDDALEVRAAGDCWRFHARNPLWDRPAAAAPSDGQLLAPMPGKVIAVDVAPGQAVAAGQRLLVLEAMKMEHRLTAPFPGTVESLGAAIGGQVREGDVLLRLVADVVDDRGADRGAD